MIDANTAAASNAPSIWLHACAAAGCANEGYMPAKPSPSGSQRQAAYVSRHG